MNAWDREDGEPALWFGRFDKFYRPLGSERSLDAAYRVYLDSSKKGQSAAERPPNSWFNNAKAWRWKERAEAWDETIRQERLAVEAEARRQAQQDATARYIKSAKAMQDIALRKMVNLQKDPDQLKPDEARRFLLDGTKLEREVLGLPTEIIGLLDLTNDELISRYGSIIAGISSDRGDSENAGD